MDRRTKLILFILLTLTVFGLVGWFIVWPALQPLLPKSIAQPPALNTPAPPAFQGGSGPSTPEAPSGSGSATFDPGSASDALVIAELSRRAGVLAERVESGSSQDSFTNLDDAQLGASPSLAATFKTMKTQLQKDHPASGPSYVTVARMIAPKPESDQITGPTFKIVVQLQIQTRDNGTNSVGYREATVTFTQSAGEWIPSGYAAKVFTP